MIKGVTLDMYKTFIATVCEQDGYEIADKANKLALASGTLTTDEYSEAARIIAHYFLANTYIAE